MEKNICARKVCLQHRFSNLVYVSDRYSHQRILQRHYIDSSSPNIPGSAHTHQLHAQTEVGKVDDENQFLSNLNASMLKDQQQSVASGQKDKATLPKDSPFKPVEAVVSSSDQMSNFDRVVFKKRAAIARLTNQVNELMIKMSDTPM